MWKGTVVRVWPEKLPFLSSIICGWGWELEERPRGNLG